MKNKTIAIVSAFVVIVVACLGLYYLYSQKQGYIKIDTAGAQMRLQGGLFSRTTISSAAEPVQVTARVYRPQWLSIVRRQNGDTWRIESSGPWGTLARLRVNEGQTTVLKPGPPFLVKANVNSRGGRVSIGYELVGQAGEQYRGSVTKNGRRQAAPKVKIVDEEGKILASGKFEYG